MHRLRSEGGAVAVEFALVMVPLLLILLGIIDFGHAYGSQLSVSAAAREGVRSRAVQGVVVNQPAAEATAKQVAISAAGELSSAASNLAITFSYADQGGTSTDKCLSGGSVTMRATYPLTSITGMFTSTFAGKTISEVGVMRCNG